MPPAAGGYRGCGLLVVAASGRSLWADLARAPTGGHLMLINHAIPFVGGVAQHLASLHEDGLPAWHFFRRTWRQYEGHMAMHSAKPHDGVESVWRFDPPPPCSGLFGALVGLALGYGRVVLAGCPEDHGGHFYDPPDTPGDYVAYQNNRPVWQWARDNVFRGRVRSLSGNTKLWLGAPDG